MVFIMYFNNYLEELLKYNKNAIFELCKVSL